MATATAKTTTHELLGMLRDKYALPAFSLITEVPDATSFGKSRSCDAMAFGCWKSQGMHIHGFELKASRADWQKELQDRSKSATFESICHFWWIVAAPGIVKLEELPSSWGLMEPGGNGLKVRSAADLRTPEPISLGMLLAIVRRASKMSPAENEFKTAKRREYDRGYQDGQAAAERRAPTETKVAELEAERLRKAITEFEEASGVAIATWDAGRIGEQFKAFQELRSGLNGTRLRQIIQAATTLLDLMPQESE